MVQSKRLPLERVDVYLGGEAGTPGRREVVQG